ncbi:MAG: ribulose-phosphate 3-epimerase [Thermoleophilia bacterium]|nr:ribulose-phosphate 3-epimerase [Thermoleophilia bacterium]
MSITLGASILAADWSRMGAELEELESAGIDYIHWDVMDNRYVPNLTFGWDMIAACRKHTTVPFEVHLMAHETERDLAKYVAAGCERVLVQPEAHVHVHNALRVIREEGAEAGIALNPGTPLSMVEDLLPDITTLLVMTVNPGFGGQAFIETMLPKIEAARALVAERAPHVTVEVDGGLKPGNVAAAVSAGARAVVCGSGLFGPEGKAAAIAAMKSGIASGIVTA